MDVAAASGDSQPGWAWTDHSMMKSSLFVFLATTTLLNIPQYSECNRMSSESRYRSNNCHEPLLSSSVFRWGSTAHSRLTTDFFNLLLYGRGAQIPSENGIFLESYLMSALLRTDWKNNDKNAI